LRAHSPATTLPPAATAALLRWWSHHRFSITDTHSSSLIERLHALSSCEPSAHDGHRALHLVEISRRISVI
jgi:hypothetical protein